MSDDIIVTQHFDDPIGSVIEVDGQCYVKISDKSDDVITHYILDGKTKTYHSTCGDCSDQINGTTLCPPEFGDQIYTIGYITGLATLVISTIKILPTDSNYGVGNYSISFINTICHMFDKDPDNIETDNRPFSHARGIYSSKTSVGFITSRVTLQDPNYIHPWL